MLSNVALVAHGLSSRLGRFGGGNIAVNITTEPDPTPLVRILASTLRRSREHNEVALARMKGVAGICSMHDPQAVTIRFDRGTVHLVHGMSDEATVTITLDLARDGLPDAPKPKVKGALFHLRFALHLAKVLEPPVPDWRDAADSFWALHRTRPYMPTGLRITDTDSGREHIAGDPDPDCYEIEGPSDRLCRIFVGSAFVLEEVLEGRVHARGSIAAATAVTRAGLAHALTPSPDPTAP